MTSAQDERSAAHRRWTAPAAAFFGLLTLAAVVAGFPLGFMSHQVRGDGVQLLIAVPFAAVGLLVAVRQPGNRMGWLLLLGGMFLAFNFTASFYVVLDYRLGGQLPGRQLALLLQPSWAPAIVCFGLAVMLFPDGRLPFPRLRWLVRPYLAIGAAWVAGAVAVTLNDIASGTVRVDATGNLVGLDVPGGATAWWGLVQSVFFVLLLVVGVGSLIGQTVRFRRSSGERRQQVKWLLSGVAVAVPGLTVSLALGGGSGSGGLLNLVSGASFVLVAGLPVSIGVAVLRYRLYDIDRVISRTLAYSAVTALLVGGYIGLVLLVTRVLPFSSAVGVAVSTLAAAAAFNPLRRRVQHLVDRRFNRARYDADLTVAAFAARLQDAVDLAAVHADLVSTVQGALEPGHLSVWLPGPRS